jgi:hypothetical protein
MPIFKVKVHPEVYGELEASRAWYEQRAKNLGIDFLIEVDYAIDQIHKSPETWTWYNKTFGIRRFLLHRFPYSVIYRYSEEVIEIIAIANLRRKPGYWKDRLSFFAE